MEASDPAPQRWQEKEKPVNIPLSRSRPYECFSSPQNGGSQGGEEASIARRSAHFSGEALNSPRADEGGGTDFEEAGRQGNGSSPASSTEPGAVGRRPAASREEENRPTL